MIESAKKTYTYDWFNKNEIQDLGPIFVSAGPVFLLTIPSKNTDHERGFHLKPTVQVLVNFLPQMKIIITT